MLPAELLGAALSIKSRAEKLSPKDDLERKRIRFVIDSADSLARTAARVRAVPDKPVVLTKVDKHSIGGLVPAMIHSEHGTPSHEITTLLLELEKLTK